MSGEKGKRSDTKQSILKAALEEFIEKGKEGARMQSIADRAGVNKALLHYYFSSKEQLYYQSLLHVFREAFATISHLSLERIDIFQFIELIVRGFFRFLRETPQFPRLFIRALLTNEKDLFRAWREATEELELELPSDGLRIVQEAVEKKAIYPYQPHHLLISIISLILFYFIGRAFIGRVYSEFLPDEETFLKEREEHIIKFIFKAIEPD